jgi:hypothetical protein
LSRLPFTMADNPELSTVSDRLQSARFKSL